MLADGTITESEYEAAVIAYLTCIEDAGFPAQGPVWNDDRTYLHHSFTAENADLDRANTADLSCDETYLDRVFLLWSDQHVLTPQEHALQLEEYKECLTSAGVEGIELITDIGLLTQTLEELGGNSYLSLCLNVNPNAYIIDVGPLPEFNGPGAG